MLSLFYTLVYSDDLPAVSLQTPESMPDCNVNLHFQELIENSKKGTILCGFSFNTR